ncbi:MAG: 2-C-methyl-D-erythritol 4-phosphate cytidylyltransferase [Dissulfurimicrobium sp.]|uniref:2-C-methyl-D-erythritol 4-phosphate cytidylyltransferase n=1 Tax=Dissulfurimicrobium sp. TaxID=2022436 RepID=UPI0040495D47
MSVSAIIAAAGEGVRFGMSMPKQFLPLGGRPLIAWSIAVMARSPLVDEIVLISSAVHEERVRKLAASYAGNKTVKVVRGGATRQESVRAGLLAVAENIKWVAVHDAARPFVTTELLEKVYLLAKEIGAAIPALPINDTVKETDDSRLILRTIDRSRLYLAQTPQVCKRFDLVRAFEDAQRFRFKATDEASLLEFIGVDIGLAEGSALNIKITFPDDLRLAEAIIASSMASFYI